MLPTDTRSPAETKPVAKERPSYQPPAIEKSSRLAEVTGQPKNTGPNS